MRVFHSNRVTTQRLGEPIGHIVHSQGGIVETAMLGGALFMGMDFQFALRAVHTAVIGHLGVFQGNLAVAFSVGDQNRAGDAIENAREGELVATRRPSSTVEVPVAHMRCSQKWGIGLPALLFSKRIRWTAPQS